MRRGKFIIFLWLVFAVSFFASAAGDSNDAIEAIGDTIGELITEGYRFMFEQFSNLSLSLNINPDSIVYVYSLFILFLVIYSLTDSIDFFNNKVVKFVIAVAITLLSALALPSDFMKFIFPAQVATAATILTMLVLSTFLFILVRMKSLFFAYVVSALATATAFTHFLARVYEAQNLVALHLLAISILLFLVTLFLPWIRKSFRKAEIDEEGQRFGEGFGLLQTLIESTGNLARKLSSGNRN